MGTKFDILITVVLNDQTLFKLEILDSTQRSNF
jgi:hypothetical protein